MFSDEIQLVMPSAMLINMFDMVHHQGWFSQNTQKTKPTFYGSKKPIVCLETFCRYVMASNPRCASTRLFRLYMLSLERRDICVAFGVAQAPKLGYHLVCPLLVKRAYAAKAFVRS